MRIFTPAPCIFPLGIWQIIESIGAFNVCHDSSIYALKLIHSISIISRFYLLVKHQPMQCSAFWWCAKARLDQELGRDDGKLGLHLYSCFLLQILITQKLPFSPYCLYLTWEWTGFIKKRRILYNLFIERSDLAAPKRPNYHCKSIFSFIYISAITPRPSTPPANK